MNKFSLCFVLLGVVAVLGLDNSTSSATTAEPETSSTATTTESSEISSTTLHREENNNKVCTPDEIKIEDSSRCKCAANGIGWFCTKLPPNKIQKREIRDRCKPGDTWKDECNFCHCTGNGVPACTKVGCGEGSNGRRNEQTCKPGDEWHDGCNSCTCLNSGVPSCIGESQCPPSRSEPQLVQISMMQYKNPNFVCNPSKFYKVECNNCVCSENGKLSCTRLNCAGLRRKGGSPALDERIQLTQKEYEDPSFTCDKTKLYKLECNFCACGEKNKLTCTKMACLPKERRNELTANDSQGKKTFPDTGVFYHYGSSQMYSTSFPDSGSFPSARRNFPEPDQQSIHNEQEIRHPSFTDRPVKVVSEEEFQDPNFRCEPKTMFMVECNTCQCLSDGRTASCTLKYCP